MILKCRKCEKQYKCPAKADIKDDCKKFKPIDKKYLVAVVDLSTNKTDRFFTNRKPQAPFQEPSREEVQSYCDEKNLHNVDVDGFLNYYTSVGWKVGNRQMKDWKAAARNWDKRQQEFDKEKQSKFDKDRIGGTSSLNIHQVQLDAIKNTEIRY